MIAEKALKEIPFTTGFMVVDLENLEVLEKSGEAEKIEEPVKNLIRDYMETYINLGELDIGLPTEMLLTFDAVFVLMRFFPEINRVFVAVTQKEANLGFVRMMMIRYSEEV
ncbi:hypothetical protein [Desulfurobacterium sp.]|uniref:hypothetical protein n=1 Tax=Desulfurobacterium sp. TaxID=2004706 RepID=UPI0026062105|nr:hypothetical protein [Desulfurobacterium sp.]